MSKPLDKVVRAPSDLLDHLLDAFVGIASNLDARDILERTVALACEVTGARFAAARVFEDGDVACTTCRALSEHEAALLLDPLGRPGEFQTGTTISRLTPTDAPAGSFSPGEIPMSAALFATVDCGSDISGVLYLAKPQGEQPFTDHDEFLVRTLARQAAGALTSLSLLHQKEREGARRSEARFRSLVQHSSDVTTLIDVDGTIQYQSPSVERNLGYSVEELIGTDSMDLVHPDERAHVRAVMVKAMKESGAATFECRLRHKQGHWLHAESRLNSLLRDPHVRGVVLNTRDISERKTLEAELSHQAFHDSLTNLANRALFSDRLKQSLKRARRNGQAVGVIFLDLDNFKKVNDTLGHAMGDHLLMAVAERLRETLRGTDTAARLGGDEFAILLEGICNEPDATVVAERILTAMALPFNLRGHEIFCRPSLGITLGRPGEYEAEELLRNADVAMYSAKAQGKGRYAMFEPGMHAAIVARADLEVDLRRALERKEFTVFYQPTVALQTGAISGLEALIRWNHPKRGLVAPMEFIPLAEDTGMIVAIGKRVLAEACRQAREWQLRHHTDTPITMSVNLSARQLQDADLVDDVVRALEDSGLDPQHLTLEITESVLMQHTDAVVGTLLQLRKLGVKLAIDDFGTGYSSLAYLQRLPVDILKIDRSFIAGLKNGSTEWAMTRAIIELGQSLNLMTVAEGIEQPEQVLHLQSLQCDLYQGYYFAKPLDRMAMEKFLAELTSADASHASPADVTVVRS